MQVETGSTKGFSVVPGRSTVIKKDLAQIGQHGILLRASRPNLQLKMTWKRLLVFLYKVVMDLGYYCICYDMIVYCVEESK